MGEPNSQNSPTDIFESRPSPVLEKSTIRSFFLIKHNPTGAKTSSNNCLLVVTLCEKKSASDYERDRVEKYATYFKDGELLPIPELVEAVEPQTLSFVVKDLRTKRLAGLKKETFEDILKPVNIPGKKKKNKKKKTKKKKLAGGNITTRFFRLQPEYRGKRRIKVTVCNVSM